jgi:hypothetical protein
MNLPFTPLAALGLLLATCSIGLAGCGGGGDTGIDEEIDLADPNPVQIEAERTPGDVTQEEGLSGSDSTGADAVEVEVDAEPAGPGLGEPAP